MGQHESKPHAPPGAAPSQHGSSSGSSSTITPHDKRQGTASKRRESIHHAPLARATASPSASLTSVTASASNSPNRSAKEALKKAQPPSQQQTQPPAQPAAPTPQLKPVDNTPQDKMGSSTSRSETEKPVDQPAQGDRLPARPSPLPRPIDVPTSGPISTSPVVSAAPGFVDGSYQFPTPSQFSRPPRLPLPIEQEDYRPGSPILGEQELISPVAPLDAEHTLPKRSSILSSTTIEDEYDDGDDVTVVDGGPMPTVPTILEWRDRGDRVYVTGTFAGWDKKFRLHKNGPSNHPGALSTTINLLPGTHHVRFIVDNDMQLSKFMPTAVDYTNFLVNYIEVAQPTQPESPGDTTTAKQPSGTNESLVRKEGATLPSSQAPQAASSAPPNIQPSHAKGDVPPKSQPKTAERSRASTDTLNSQVDLAAMAPLAVGPTKQYHSEIPQCFIDLDAPEESSRYARASRVFGACPVPPSLPMFLGKSVLNGTLPMKDDASVLILPNHTVINHLATSSIKAKVLATSATTRYKRKFLTTILYKPTTAD